MPCCSPSPWPPRTSPARDDCVARIGGDEFALLAPGAGAAGVLRLLRDLRDSIEPVGHLRRGHGPGDARTPDELVACADARLLAQKRDVKRAQSRPGASGRQTPRAGLASGAREASCSSRCARSSRSRLAAPAVAAERPVGDGAWSWFGDPRAVTHDGRTYVGLGRPGGRRQGQLVRPRDRRAGDRRASGAPEPGRPCEPVAACAAGRAARRLLLAPRGPGDALPRVVTAGGRDRLGPPQTVPTNTPGIRGYTYPNPIRLDGRGRHLPVLARRQLQPDLLDPAGRRDDLVARPAR